MRVGNVSAYADFAQNELLGRISGPPSAKNVDIVFERKVPIVGKFVTFAELQGDKILICMLEIY